MVKSRAIKNPVKIERYWLLSKEETETFIKVNSFLNDSNNNESYSKNNDSNSKNNATKESKGKERKVKEKKHIETAAPADLFNNQSLENAFQLFITCRKQNGQKLSVEQIKLLRQELLSMGADDQERIAIANKATVSGWKSFYPLKKSSGKKQPSKNNKFNNFHQRDYDYEKLESELLNK
jgi:hypothetical protein